MNLKFGTGGLRAVMGEGEEYLNLQTIGETTLGVVRYIKKRKKQPNIAVVYDSRNHSEEYAKETARIFALCDCNVWISHCLMPTPFLSYGIRKLQCDLGISITASHNSKEYNGYKVYNQDGCQITLKAAEEISEEIKKAAKLSKGKKVTFEELILRGKIQFLPKTTIEEFCEDVLQYGFHKKVKGELKVVYTPLNGAGKNCILNVLEKKGIKNIHIVKEQEIPDGNFPTCPYPNPEDEKAMELGMLLCEKTEADLLLATDPDGDRVGVAAKKDGRYCLLSGNQVGVLLTDYILERRKQQGTLPRNPLLMKTIVTTEMINRIAEDYNAEVINTLTGFKYIGEKICQLEECGQLERFVFGLEESCGYLIGPYVRDKDAIGASMLICEMAEVYKSRGMTLWDRLQELYEKYGFFESVQKTRNLDKVQAKQYMEKLRRKIKEIGERQEYGGQIVRYTDYLEKKENLPGADVLQIWFADQSSVIIRPSGTEPKIKFYYEKISDCTNL